MNVAVGNVTERENINDLGQLVQLLFDFFRYPAYIRNRQTDVEMVVVGRGGLNDVYIFAYRPKPL